MKVVISYTNDGDKYAESLERDLKSQSIGIWIDKHCVEPGKNWLKEIDRALYQIDYVLGVITPNYPDSIGGDEAYAKMAEGFRKKEMSSLVMNCCAAARSFECGMISTISG